MSMAEVLTVFKMVGAGNDFLFLNLFDAKSRNQIRSLEKKLPRQEIAKKLCRRNESIGADGFIFIEKSKGINDFTWDFYNSDGSSAEMCGNAARCAVRFSKDVLKFKKKVVSFHTASGDITGKLVGKDRAQVRLSAPKIHHDGLSVAAGQKNWTGTFLDTGVPHFVTESKYKTAKDLSKAVARVIQTHKIFGEQQTNVTFIEILKKNRVRAVTFERGVQDFTKACGTGAIAAAFVAAEKTKVQGRLFVEMPGGELCVEFDNSGNTSLEGEALLLGKTLIYKEALYGTK